ncbi:gephyrin-like molybdotransferase Glp [Thalassococcus sp. BH17M4-6]|uniref:molybdopterin molybdotransferase MoeA n=1 Tax=Thalassococcus sp. BH17M4-6 TaxID=3413148 RepID=UPI003BDFDA03
MITVSEALDQLFALASPLHAEDVPLLRAADRILADDVVAERDQPPFPASAMDGYAVCEAQPGAVLTVIGESAAGHRFDGAVSPGEAVRIFTGAPVPEGAKFVVIQEDVTRSDDQITLGDRLDAAPHIRPAGNDFRAGMKVPGGTRLGANDIALLAAMNIGTVRVRRRPVVAIIATGDELVMPGETPGPDQIIASNSFGLHALMRQLGAAPRMLPIARDHPDSLRMVLALAQDADLVLTIGGASVGDHDLVARVAGSLGLEQAFYKVAMRPGKPLMAGRLGGAMMIGLPGNPVSAMVCGHIFVAPVIRAMLGLGQSAAPCAQAPLAADIGANGPREHYMRARLDNGALHVFDRQDSSLLSVLGQANALVVRPPHDPAQKAGAMQHYIAL